MSYLNKLKSFSALTILVILFIACGPSSHSLDQAIVGGDVEPSPQRNDAAFSEAVPTICSALNFSNVRWPSDFMAYDQMAFSLAMNITGSFEGHAGWTNLSNNFDGQGVSMGILNQNLGQGSLQPLLLQMRDSHIDVLQKAMSQVMLDSMLKMLASWERSTPIMLRTFSAPLNVPVKTLVERGSDLGDVDKKYQGEFVQTRSNSSSVRWAKKNLYTDSRGRKFKSTWRSALKQIAGDPNYVSLQIAAAQYIHNRAHKYKVRLGWDQLRSYLFLFDIVVQNGSLRDKHFTKYEEWNSQSFRATEEEKMLKMLEIRVKDSNPKWQNDVRIRKKAIIKGMGFVHGEDRNLPIEYCYDPVDNYVSPVTSPIEK